MNTEIINKENLKGAPDCCKTKKVILPGEVEGVEIEFISMKGASQLNEMAFHNRYDTILFLKGEGHIESDGFCYEVTGEHISRLPYKKNYSIHVKQGMEIQFLRFRKALDVADLGVIFQDIAIHSEIYLKALDQCPVYTEDIKSSKSINRMILPEGMVPRFCMGSVETKGPDSVGEHSHPMLDQLFLGLEGCKCTCSANGDKTILKEDMILHIPLGSNHSVSVEDGDNLSYIWLDFFHTLNGQKYMSEQQHIEYGKIKQISKIFMLFFCMIFITFSCNNPSGEDMDLNEEKSKIVVNYGNSQGTIEPVWNGINSGFLTQNLSENIPDLNDLYSNGFRYLRFQETLHRVYTENDENGNPVYNWEYFNKVLDKAVGNGFKLLIVLESTPDPLAENVPKPGYEWCNRHSPADYNKWYMFIKDVIKHCQERYGDATIESWYWEVWNEPYAPLFFYGSKQDYFKIYDYTVSAVKSVNPNLRIGGNIRFFGESILADRNWLKDHIEHCLYEKNACTGKIGTSLDFLSFHPYPITPGVDITNTPVLDNLESTLKQINTVMGDYGIPNIPVIISEWNISSNATNLRDMSFNAAFAVRASKIFLEYQVEQLFFHTICDYVYYEYDGFSGGGGLFTTSGIPKAVFNSLTLMNKLYFDRLKLESDNGNIDGIASISGNKVNIICANYEGNPRRHYETNVEFRIKNIPATYKRIKYSLYIIDDSHCDAYMEWIAMGSKDKLSTQEKNTLKNKAKLKIYKSETVSLSNNVWLANIVLSAHGVVFIEAELVH